MWFFSSWSCPDICLRQVWIIPFAFLLGRRMDFGLLYWSRTEPCIPLRTHWCCLGWEGAWSLIPVILGSLSSSEFTRSSHLLGSPAWQNSAFLTQEAALLSHKEKYFSYHLMSCPWPWNMRLAIQRRDGRIKLKVDVYFLLGLFWLDVSFCNWNRRNKPLFISIF